MSRQKRQKKKFVCFCNGIDQSTIEDAIKNGAETLDEIFDQTRAGVGACGGSCRPDIKRMLDQYLTDASFPNVEKDKRKK